MLTSQAIQHLGNFHIRTCHKTMWSNGKDMLGGSFKSQSKDSPLMTPSEGFRPLLPSGVSHSSHGQSSFELHSPSIGHENHSPRNLLHQICEELGVTHYGN